MLGICIALGLSCATAEVPPAGAVLAPPPLAAPARTMSAPDVTHSAPALSHPSTWSHCVVEPPDELARLFTAVERRHPAVSACDLATKAFCESNYRADARSPVGALGLFQFLPPTARDLGIDPLDPREATIGASRYVDWLRAPWDPNIRPAEDVKALADAAFNWGRRRMFDSQRQHGWTLYDEAHPHLPLETRRYRLCHKLGYYPPRSPHD